MAHKLTELDPARILASGTHHGIDWHVASNNLGFRCGYARVPEGHPFFRKGWDDIGIDVHGGITYAEYGTEKTEWWLGFDCAHNGDAPDPELPGSEQLEGLRAGTVKSQAYAEAECIKMCNAIIAAAPENQPEKATHKHMYSPEFAVHQLEQAMLTLVALGDESTVEQLSRLHEYVLSAYEDEYAKRVAQAVECIMEAILAD